MKNKNYISTLIFVISIVSIGSNTIYATENEGANVNQLQQEIETLKKELSDYNSRIVELENREFNQDSIAERIVIHGFASQGYMKTNNNNYLGKSKNGSFEFNETGINFSAMLTNRLRVGLQLFSRDMGDVGNNDLNLDWAYADYRRFDWLALRAGLIKVHSGLYNKIRDIDAARVWIFLPTSVYIESVRDNNIAIQGYGVYGFVPLGILGQMEYESVWGIVNLSGNGGTAKFAQDQAPMLINRIELDQSSMQSLIWNTPLDGLRAGFFYGQMGIDFYAVNSHNPTEALNYYMDSMTTTVFSLEFIYEKLVLAAEFKIVDKDQHVNEGPQFENQSDGWYINGSYEITYWFELGLGYSEYYSDTDDREGEHYENPSNPWDVATPDFQAWQKDIVICTRFNITDYWTLKIEGHSINGVAAVFKSDNDGDANNLEKDWFLGAAKLTFNF